MTILSGNFFIHDFLSNKNDKWFDRVYLCIEKPTTCHIINGFHCYIFPTYENAYKYYKKMNYNEENNRVALITICKWVPNFFHPYLLKHKLTRLYWHNNVTIMRPINRS